MSNQSNEITRERFATNGYAIVRNVYDSEGMKSLSCQLQKTFETIYQSQLESCKNSTPSVLNISREIIENSTEGKTIEQYTTSVGILDFLETLLGPDIAIYNHLNLWINDPRDDAIVTNKSLHQEFWSGLGPNELTVWSPINDVSAENTMMIVPGSHLYGLLPNRNRQLLPIQDIELPSPVPLVDISPGDAVIFHSFLLHGTAGRDEQLRIAMSAVYKPTFAQTTVKNHATGFRALRLSALTKVRSILANDSFTPLRTYGGPISNQPLEYEQDYD